MQILVNFTDIISTLDLTPSFLLWTICVRKLFLAEVQPEYDSPRPGKLTLTEKDDLHGALLCLKGNQI